MKEVSFNEWWKSKEDEILNRFSSWSDVEEIKKICLDCWTTQNTNYEIKITLLEDGYDEDLNNHDEDEPYMTLKYTPIYWER